VSATKPMITHSCQVCHVDGARRFYIGWRCGSHAPTEQQIRDHAIQRAARNDRERAVPNHPRETR
jgi:hypothetical protein